MRRSLKRNPRVSRLMLVAVILVGGGAAILWAKTWLVPDLTAEARAAYARQDWKGTELLARKRLKQVPDDPTALRLAARAAAQQDRDQSAIAIYSQLFVRGRGRRGSLSPRPGVESDRKGGSRLQDL